MKNVIFILLSFLSTITFAQSTFYISNNGNDNNSGTSPSAPWKTIKNMIGGNTYLLKKGEKFHFDFSIYKSWHQNPEKKLILSSYGSGSKPVLSLYKSIKGASWQKHSENIWKVDIKNAGNYTGFITTDTNVGFLKVNGIMHGNKLSSLSKLASKWDFYTDKTYLYVYSSSNPSTGNPTIEASSNTNAIELGSNMEIANIAIEGSGAHAINGNNIKNVTLKNIDITEIGGSYLAGYGNGTTRFGNGIQFWNGSNNCLIEGCTISKVYDVAFTMQGNNPNTAFVNTTFQNNSADSNEQSLEMWVSGNAPGFTNCKFINNNCSNAGYGWSHDLRPDKNVGVHILTYAWEVKNSDVLIQGNTFNKAKTALYFWGYEWDPMPKFTSKNNTVFLEAKKPLRSMINLFTIENPNSFVSQTGKEIGTIFNTIKLVSTEHLKAQTINFQPIPAKMYGDSPFPLQASASSGLPITFNLVYGPAKLAGNQVTITGPGTVAIKATQTGNSVYHPAQETLQTFIVSKKSQTIHIDTIGIKKMDTSPITLNATASSGLSIKYSLISGPATLSNNIVTPTGAGTIFIQASQPGNEFYFPATPVTKSITISSPTPISISTPQQRRAQTIYFTAIPAKVYGDAPFTLQATSSSGLPVTFSKVTWPVTVKDNQVTINSTGTVTIKATQEGNSHYLPAPEVTQTFTISKSNQTIVFTPIGDQIYGTAPISLNATATSGLEVRFTVIGGPAKLSGNILTFTGTGTVKLRASQDGNGYYKGAEQVYQTINVSTLPTNKSTLSNSVTSQLIYEGNKNFENDDRLLAYPNPFSNKITLDFFAETDENSVLEVFDLNGSLIKVIHRNTGEKDQICRFIFDGHDYSNGIYLCRLKTGSKIIYKKIILEKTM